MDADVVVVAVTVVEEDVKVAVGDRPILAVLIHGCRRGYRVAPKPINGTQMLERTMQDLGKFRMTILPLSGAVNGLASLVTTES